MDVLEIHEQESCVEYLGESSVLIKPGNEGPWGYMEIGSLKERNKALGG